MSRDVKAVIETAHFSIPADTPYDGFLVVKKKFKQISRRTSESMLLNARDILINGLLVEFRPKPAMNVWRKRLPMEIIEYCYKTVPYRRMSFVYDARDIGDTELDFLICLFDDRHVSMTSDYARYYDSSMRKRSLK